ncbi:MULTISPECIES: MFS transporter [unclassified Saccharopolyspora]|uniref:MFS transporter n=1 Tax=unclassified Saccharopolyspora TaxID=2646250 RepID=UPI001CD3A2A8|nr:MULTISPECIES: MFS transporter [unclassified Saccharopolyspora]MCA1184903.1 MFS transporter [Saccharopolyspora sp. 6T]MCA1229889.1 MFS transporter [Saccharopolyspora sp. 6M]MCA1279931.1 MFS transporter [Saccharopolyspora sp. 7B]
MSTTTCAYEDAPLTRFHLRVAVSGTGGQFSDGFILGIIGIVIAAAGESLGLTALWKGLLGAATLVGLFAGAVLVGPIADRIGRRGIFAWNMPVFAVLSLAQFFVQTPGQLLVLRLLLGIVLGADYVVSKSLVTEHAPVRYRGRLMSLLAVAWAAGYVFAYLAGFLLTGLGPDAWRYMLVVSAVPALLVAGFRFGIPESPLWLVRHGREAAAAAAVRRHLGPDVLPPTVPPSTGRRGLRALFGPVHRRRTTVGAVFYVCQVVPFFALGTFSPQVMAAFGVTGELGAGALYNGFLLAGAVVGLALIDRISRRLFLIGSFVLGGVLLAGLTLFSGGPATSVVLFTAFAFVLAAAVNLEFVYPPELFPTDLRASGVGLAVAASRIGSAASTFLLPLVADAYGMNVALGGCVVVLFLGAAICWLWAPETSTEVLD